MSKFPFYILPHCFSPCFYSEQEPYTASPESSWPLLWKLQRKSHKSEVWQTVKAIIEQVLLLLHFCLCISVFGRRLNNSSESHKRMRFLWSTVIFLLHFCNFQIYATVYNANLTWEQSNVFFSENIGVFCMATGEHDSSKSPHSNLLKPRHDCSQMVCSYRYRGIYL